MKCQKFITSPSNTADRRGGASSSESCVSHTQPMRERGNQLGKIKVTSEVNKVNLEDKLMFNCVGPRTNIEIEIDGEKAIALVDTGATISLLEEHLVTGDIKILPYKMNVKVVGGGAPIQLATDLCTQQYIKLPDGTSHKLNFFIVPSLGLNDTQVLLGTNSLADMEATVTYPKGEPIVIIKGQVIPTLMNKRYNDVGVLEINKNFKSDAWLITAESVRLPANTVCSMYVKMSKGKRNNGPVLVYPTPDYEHIMPPEMMANSRNGRSVITVSNMTPTPIVIKKGEIVAYCHYELQTFSINLEPLGDNDNRVKDLLHEAFKVTPSAMHNRIDNIVNNFHDVFALEADAPGFCDKLPFSIDTGTCKPIVRRPYRVPMSQREQVEVHLKKLLDQGIISVSSSPWHSPIVLVKKKDGSLRICIDFRTLNAQTKGDAYPLPVINELFLDLRGNKYFSTLDLKSGYYQIALDPSSKEKTAFSFNNVLYEFNCLPFGLKNAPAHFSRLMRSVLTGLIGSAVLFYLDDIIVLGKTEEEHLANLVKVLDCLRAHKLRVRLDKCHFFKTEVEYLGHLISSEGIKPIHDKVQSIREYARPQNCREVRSFLGLANYYRKFIKDFGAISRPLDALRNCENFVWETEHENSFLAIKQALTSDALLVYPNFDKPFFVICDASKRAIGGVIAQLDGNNKERPISFASRALTKTESRYSTIEREALAIKWVISKHRYMLLGYPIYVKTDHQPLTYMVKLNDPTHRLARWMLELSDYNIEEVKYIQGKANVVADALSRAVEPRDLDTTSPTMSPPEAPTGPQVEMEGVDATVAVVTRSMVRPGAPSPPQSVQLDNTCPEVPSEVLHTNENNLWESNELWTIEELKHQQNEDPLYGPLCRYLRKESKQLPDELSREISQYALLPDLNGILYKMYILPSGRVQECVVIPSKMAQTAIAMCHCSPTSGHLGVKATVHRIKQHFYVRKVYAKVKEFIRQCHICNCSKSHNIPVPPAGRWPNVRKKGDRVHMDLIGPLPPSEGYRYILTIVDAYSRFTWAYALIDKTADSVAAGLKKFVNTFSNPRVIISDNGTEFVNNALSRMFKMQGVTHRTITAYHPAANGLVESKNKMIIQILRALCFSNPDSWACMLETAVSALNTAYNRSIGDTPYFVMYGQDARPPYETFDQDTPPPWTNFDDFCQYYRQLDHRTYKHVQTMLDRASIANVKDYDSKFKTKSREMPIGSRVYVRKLQPSGGKLNTKFVGPYRVLKDQSNKVLVRSLVTDKEYNVHKQYVLMVPEAELPCSENLNARKAYPTHDLPDLPEGESWDGRGERVEDESNVANETSVVEN